VDKEYLTLKEVAEQLRISQKKVKALIEQEGLPAYDLGTRARRVPVSEFEDWLEGRRIEPQDVKEGGLEQN
jgi:excisionase family DNA binding protein